MNETIDKLEEYKNILSKWNNSRKEENMELRSYLNRNLRWVRQEILEAGCFYTVTISPPPAVGGIVMQNLDPFTLIYDHFNGYYARNLIMDMIDQTIGILLEPKVEARGTTMKHKGVAAKIKKNYAFVAMAIDPANSELDDVLDAIKEASFKCGVQAERVDEVQSNERITDRILESINKAEYVIVDLTYAKPNRPLAKVGR